MEDEAPKQDAIGAQHESGSNAPVLDAPPSPSLQNGANNNSRRRRPARRQAVNLPVYEKQNWLLFLLFSQQDFDKCMASSRTHECHLRRVTAHCIEAMRALTHRLARKQHICALHQRSLATSAAADGSHMHGTGLIQRSNGQVSTSLDTLQDVLRQDPSNCQVALDVARNMFLLGRFKAALHIYDQLESVASSPRNAWRLQTDRSHCLRKLDRLDEAADAAEQAVKLVPNVASLKLLGSIHEARGNLSAAIDAYTQALSVSPENTDIMLSLGLCYLYTSNMGRAFEFFGNALAYDPKDTDAILGASSIIQNNNDFDVALVKYRVSAVKTPEAPEVWNNVGMCFFGKKKYIAAIACLKHAAYLAPFEWIIVFNLGLVHLTVNQHASAFHYFTAAINLNQTFAPSYGLLGVTLHKLEDDLNAEMAFQKSLELDSENALTLLNYIIVLLEHDRQSEAHERWAKFKEVVAKRKSFMVENPHLKEAARQVSASLKSISTVEL